MAEQGSKKKPATTPTEQIRPAELQEFEPGSGGETRRGIEMLADVALQLTVELGRVTMPIRDLLATGPGSVITLDRHAHDPVDILAGDQLIARGEVVVIGHSMGVRVTELVKGSTPSDKEVTHAADDSEPEQTKKAA